MVDMATLGIRVTSDGMSQAQSGLDGLTRSGAAAERSVGSLGSASAGLVTALAKIAAAAGGVYAIQRAFQAGIKAVDDYRVAVVGIAATLTDMAKPGQGSMETIFARNKAAATDMYRAISLEAAKHFSSLSEGMMVYNRLVQSGYSVQVSEVSDLLLLTDKIKLATRGQNVEMQLNTEIIALMSGQARAQSMIAMELQSRLGSGWGELVKKHREAGDLLKWIASLFPGLVTANQEIESTLNSQWATTKSLLYLISISGLGGAYDDIVSLVKEANSWLREHEAMVSGALKSSWSAVRDLVDSTLLFIKEIHRIVSVPVKWTIEVVGAGASLLSGSAEGGVYWAGGQEAGLGIPGIPRKQVSIPGSSTFGLGDLMTFGMEGPPATSRKLTTNPYQATQLLRSTGADSFMYSATGELIPVYGTPNLGGKAIETASRPDKPGKGGGGSGKDPSASAEAAVAKFIDTMTQETAKGAGDTEAILAAWKNKQISTLEELAAKGADITKGKEALAAAVDAKQRKLDSEFDDWYAAGMGNQYDVLANTEKKKLAEVAGNQVKITKVHEVSALARAKLDDQVQSNTMNLFKGYLDTMASIEPTLEGQLKLKRESLDLELKIANATLERQIREKQIVPELADQARQLAAIAAQAKKYNLEMENNKGLSGWAYGRVKSDSGKNTISDMMGGLESGLQSSFSSAWQGFLTQDKKNLKKAGESIFQGLLGEITKGSITKLFSGAAGLFATKSPLEQYGMGAGSGKGVTGTVSDTGAQLSKAADGLNTASVGFNANTAQFGLAAGGLLLSGIGIATNSQAMVVAGTVLQVAGMAIQVYQALAGTTQMGAAAALTGSAAALTAAAGAIAAAAGSNTGSGIFSGAIGVVKSIFGFHQGGIITAHNGWPRLRSDEVPIIAQTGERVLSRRQNRDYEAGMVAGGGGNRGGLSIGAIHIDARGADKNIDWKKVVRKQIAPELKRLMGNTVNG